MQPGLLVLFMDLYCYHEKLDEALDYYKRTKSMEGSKIDASKAVRLANLLCKNDKYQGDLTLPHYVTVKDQACEVIASIYLEPISDIEPFQLGQTARHLAVIRSLAKSSCLVVHSQCVLPMCLQNIVCYFF